jgi:ABC-type uncharacterized transport system ATPase subunit
VHLDEGPGRLAPPVWANMRIELVDIHKRYGPVVANDGVNLAISAGEIRGLLGENGAGKTTLMRILSGYTQADAGQVWLDGVEHRLHSPADALRAGVGMLHQDPMDVPQLSVLDNFTLGQDGGFYRRRGPMVARLEALCQRFGFALDPGAVVGSLTVGERQQLELVRLLALGARTIILDEPTTGISAPQKLLLFKALKDLAREGLSVVFVSHKLDEVQALCDSVTVLRKGRNVGELPAPFAPDSLVALMFGEQLPTGERPTVDIDGDALQVQQLSVRDHRLTLDKVALSVRRGEVLGLAGLEGSGQQLLMQAIAGVVRPRAGSIRLGADELVGRPYEAFRNRGIALVPAARLEEGMVPGLTLREHFALCHHCCRGLMLDWPAAEGLTYQQIRAFNIVGEPLTAVDELSGGNQQRALLALLPADLSVLLLEHPTRGLDVSSAQWIWSNLLARRERGTALIFTSTDLDELLQYSDRIMVFSGGRVSAPVDAATVTVQELGYLIGGRGL